MKQYQRIWNNKRVDNNLEDFWLEHLNDLELFNLISICEGHSWCEHPYDRAPHINLRLKLQHLADIHAKWLPCREAIHNLVGQSSICDEIYIHASFSHEYSFPDASIRREEFGIQVLCKHLRTCLTPEPWFSLWFLQAMTLIEAFDKQMVNILSHCEHR